ncbi:hypothetical protein [uncultured Jatrophihabitans sp.]|uniref:hypothetical protein n=1 Tax=uncultured Jatrophihabitans sp. TaxID=1610747 RepID=UPI0035C9EC3A
MRSVARRFGRRNRRRVRELWPAQGALLALTLVLCAAPFDVVPHPGFGYGGLDASWKSSLNLAHPQGLQFGKDFDFTYGPWGFVDWPLAFSRVELALSVVFWVLTLGFTWLALRATVSRVTTRIAAAAISTVVLVLCTPETGESASSASAVLVVGAALVLLDHAGAAGPRRARRWAPAVCAALAAFVLQVKFSEGVLLIVMVAIACLFTAARRLVMIASAVVAFVVTTVVAWVVAGQHLGNFWSWLRASYQISKYYTDAMGHRGGSHFDYLVLAIVLLGVLALAVRFWVVAGLRRGLGVILISALVEYLALREGTGRFDAVHLVAFFLYSLPVVVWLATAGSVAQRGTARRHVRRRPILLVAGGALCVLVVLEAQNNAIYLNPHTVAHRWGIAVRTVAVPARQQAILDLARRAERSSYAVPPGMLATIGRHPVSVDGSDSALPWAYRMHSVAEPLVQSYNAYSGELDRIATDRLRSLPADAYILRPVVTGIDHRSSLWDPPLYVRTEMCSTIPVSSNARWLLLRKSADRCAAAKPAGTVRVAAGRPVTVPHVAAGQMVTMSFQPDGPGLGERLRRLVDKPSAPLIVTARGRRIRLPRALAAGPLIVQVPAEVGWPAAFGGHRRFTSVAFSEPGTVHFATTGVQAGPSPSP